jgi:hypothetical protein
VRREFCRAARADFFKPRVVFTEAQEQRLCGIGEIPEDRISNHLELERNALSGRAQMPSDGAILGRLRHAHCFQNRLCIGFVLRGRPDCAQERRGRESIPTLHDDERS